MWNYPPLCRRDFESGCCRPRAQFYQNMLSKYRSGIDASVKGMSNVARREALPKQVKSFLIACVSGFHNASKPQLLFT
jgi:hypothetical protein